MEKNDLTALWVFFLTLLVLEKVLNIKKKCLIGLLEKTSSNAKDCNIQAWRMRDSNFNSNNLKKSREEETCNWSSDFQIMS